MPPPERASFVISIDLEMSWGAIHHGRPHDPRPYVHEREVVAGVLALMNEYGISATWAVVGHLFLAECPAGPGPPHPEVGRPAYPWLEGDWYDLDPRSNWHDAPTWYAPDLVATIRASATPQEIASHSFAHVIAGEPGCTREAFSDDLAAAKKVATAEGIVLRSFVYPRNSIGHLDELERAGFSAFRGPTPERFPGHSPWRRQALGILDRLWPAPGATVSPSVHGRLVDIPQTYLFDPDSSMANRLGTRGWTALIRRRLRHAVRTSSLFHMWFHTHNLGGSMERAFQGMDAVFGEARRHIDTGRLESVTMGDLAQRVLDDAVAPGVPDHE